MRGREGEREMTETEREGGQRHMAFLYTVGFPKTPTVLTHPPSSTSLSEGAGHQPRRIRFSHEAHFSAKTAGLSLSGEISYFIIKTADRNPLMHEYCSRTQNRS